MFVSYRRTEGARLTVGRAIIGDVAMRVDTGHCPRDRCQFYRLLSFDLPRRVVRDVHGGIATSTGQCRHPFACKWLTSSHPRVLAGATSDDVGAAVHIWLRFVDVTGIESRENLVTVSICQNAGAIDVFLGT